MFDLRKTKTVKLDDETCLKEDITYKFKEEVTGKKLVAKFLGYYNDETDEYLIREFRKMALLSGEPEIGTVYFLATGFLKGQEKSCYIMDFIEGQTLASFLENANVISHEVAVDIVSQIASGLEKAHNYDICHSDLHEGNIMIDKIGYVKLIDFLWWDFKMQAQFNIEKDISDFKKIAEMIFSKCSLRNSIVKQLCLAANEFKGLKKKILQINDIAFDWEKIPEDSQVIISHLLNGWDGNRMYNSVFSEIVLINKNLIPELDSNEQKHKLKSDGLYAMLDANRRLKIESNIEQKFLQKLNPLKQAGLLIDWNINVRNRGQSFEGPYLAQFIINLSGKFYMWKKSSLEFDFLKSSGTKNIIFDQIIS